MKENKQKEYLPPGIEVVTVRVEGGYGSSVSIGGSNADGDGVYGDDSYDGIGFPGA